MTTSFEGARPILIRSPTNSCVNTSTPSQSKTKRAMRLRFLPKASPIVQWIVGISYKGGMPHRLTLISQYLTRCFVRLPLFAGQSQKWEHRHQKSVGQKIRNPRWVSLFFAVMRALDSRRRWLRINRHMQSGIPCAYLIFGRYWSR